MNLPEKKGYNVVHVHEEGESCVFSLHMGYVCTYVPKLRTRVLAFLRSKIAR